MKDPLIGQLRDDEQENQNQPKANLGTELGAKGSRA
jgi:hypothetical protein